jgi:hypothetical protein
MNASKVIIILLRQPKSNNTKEMRSDPFWEFGSFGCTRCHNRNIMNPGRSKELAGKRFAFAQGGLEGFKLVFLSPPVTIIDHSDFSEAKWSPTKMPFKYKTAPLLIDNHGKTDFPNIKDLIKDVNRTTWAAKFSSAFRSRRKPLTSIISKRIITKYDQIVSSSNPEVLAKSYFEALPNTPPKIDTDRKNTYESLLGLSSGCLNRTEMSTNEYSCRTKKYPINCGRKAIIKSCK